MRNHILNATLIALAIILPLLGLEFAFRLIRVLSNKPPYYQSDPVLGWAPVPDSNIDDMPVTSSDGTIYRVSFSTNRHGIRFAKSDWLATPSHEISQKYVTLILGDSFTGDAYTSDSDAWFASLNRDLALPVYAYGIGGSGTYQQYLALKKLLPIVKPKIIILQACSNDHADNNPAFIFSSSIRNQELRRPYLSTTGAPFYAQGVYASAYRIFFSSSQLFAYIDNQLAKKGLSLPFSHAGTVSQSASVIGEYEGSSHGLTKEALRLFVSEARSYDPNIKIFGVLCSSEQSLWWEKAFESLGAVYIHEPVSAVEQAERKGMSVRIHDFAHWNILGNQIFGKELARQLKKHLDL